LELFKSFRIIVESFVNAIWGLALEVLLVIHAFLFEIFNGVFDFSLELSVTFLNDSVSFVKAVLELKPGFI
jgi:hypothetical protein